MVRDLVKECIQDKETWFNIKRLNIPQLGDDYSTKTLDVNHIIQKDYKQSSVLREENQIFERSKNVRDYNTIEKVISEAETSKICSFFETRRWLEDHYYITHMTFNFNPYNHIRKIEEMAGFLRYYYEFSKNFIFIPNIRKHKIPFDKDKPHIRTLVDIIPLEEYIKFVDETHDFFSSKNSKPIFVPISLKLSMPELEQLIEHYMKNERFYYWVDFEGTPLSEVQIAKIKHINSIVTKHERFDDSFTAFTDVKREIISKRKDPKSPASDVLCPLLGANLVGVNREPARPIPQINPVKKEDLFKHKAREFNCNSYYYEKTSNPLFLKKETNITNNALRLGTEFENQKTCLLEESDIIPFLQNKEMLVSYQKGKLLGKIRKSDSFKQTTLDDLF